VVCFWFFLFFVWCVVLCGVLFVFSFLSFRGCVGGVFFCLFCVESYGSVAWGWGLA